MHQLVLAFRERSLHKLPRRPVVVTFDDGYADNLYQAKPLLAKYDVPATVFVATGTLDQSHEFWWDELERLVLRPGPLPDELCLMIRGKIYSWKLGKALPCSNGSNGDPTLWRAWDDDDPSPRHTLYRALYHLLFPLEQTEREVVLSHLRDWCGAEKIGRPSHRPMNREEIVRLADGGLVAVGAHSVTHAPLSSLPLDVQAKEIQASKAALEEALGAQVTSFAYPFGRREDYTEATVRLVHQAGFLCACAAVPGRVAHGRDLYQLPRCTVMPQSGDSFARWLGETFRR